MTRWMVVLGGVLLAAGLMIGFVPVSASGSSCGSAFVSSSDATVNDYTTLLEGGSLSSAHAAGDCDSSRSTWRVVALALLVPGALLGAASFVGWVRENP